MSGRELEGKICKRLRSRGSVARALISCASSRCAWACLMIFGAIVLSLTASSPVGVRAQEASSPVGTVQEAPPAAATAPIPKPELERPTVWGEPTEVRIMVYILDVDEVDSAAQNFAASVFYEARWNIPLLAHEGPGPIHRRLTEVWTPRLAIVNQQQAWAAFPAAVEVYPEGEVVYRQKVWGRFSQPLTLYDFPFDHQTLSVQIVAAGLLEDEVRLVPLLRGKGRQSGIARQFSLPDWDVVAWQAGPKPYVPFEGQPGTAGFEMRIEVGRRHLYWVTKVIVPLCLIVIMSWIPFWIDPEQVSTRIGIATTSFLTLVAYLFAISVLLPPVSYVTRMDRFILLSTVMVFAGLVQATWSSVLIKKERTSAAERIDRWSCFIYPVALAAVLIFPSVFDQGRESSLTTFSCRPQGRAGRRASSS